jgi:quercetin dioxygenase-like cupin family protein
MKLVTRGRLVVAMALMAGIGAGATLPAAFAGSEPTAVRDALAQTSKVQGAPQRSLVLSRVVVEPGAELALHHHLGTQVAHVEAGVLTYTVRSGSVAVREGQSDQASKPVRTIRAGQTARIAPGEWIVEQPSDIHQAANRGPKPVVIYIATLLKKGAPPATPVSPSASR